MMKASSVVLLRGLELSDPTGENYLRSLIVRCKQGDERAWDEFYARYFNMIAHAVKRYCRPGVDEVDDLIQEVFVNLFRSLKSYDVERPLEAYILEITRRVRISRFRQISALKRGGGNPGSVSVNVHDSAIESACLSVASSRYNQEEALAIAQERRVLRKAVLELSEDCRKLLSMRYEHDLSYIEMADRLGVREGTLRVRVRRCISKLAEIFSEVLPREAKKQ
jgi:RNA polymerase sigma-70 factor (ECF subfamily)